MYIGECIDLSNRFNYGYGHIAPRACFEGGQPTNCKINHHVLWLAEKGRKVQLWFRRTRHHKHIERELLAQLMPPWNGRQRSMHA